MQDNAILPVHVVGIELHLQGLADELVHTAWFGGEDFGVLELDVMVLVKHVLCHCQVVRLSKLNKLAVFFQPGLCALANPTNVKMITLKTDAVHN